MKNYLDINNVIYISIGAIAGSLLRWQLEEIFILNVIGCFVIGLINSLSLNSKYKLIFSIGLCGSLTTFSGLILEVFKLVSNGFYIKALLGTMLMTIMGFFAVALGNLLAKKITNLF